MFATMPNLPVNNAENSAQLKSTKAVNTKSKGLSIRSASDTNINSTFGGKHQGTQTKELHLKSVREKQKLGISPNSKSPHSSFGIKKAGEDFTFKKPTDVKNHKKNIFPEPEKTGYYDEEKDFNENLYNVGRDKKFTTYFTSRLIVKPFEDDISNAENFEVSPILSDFTDVPEFLNDTRDELNGPELPSV